MQIIRGDTCPLKFQCKDGGGTPITTVADAVYFTVKTSYDVEAVTFQKTLEDMTFDEDGTYHFEIEPSDTEELPYGTYVYDIEITRGDTVKTISQGQLKITKEATWKANKESNNG